MPRIVDAEKRRAAITEATARVIARGGIDAVTMREVATEAGWTTGVITHYFENKRDLLLATFQVSLSNRQSLRLPESAPTDSRLRGALEGALPITEARKRHWLVTLACLLQASSDQSIADAQRSAYRDFRTFVTDLVQVVDAEAPPPRATDSQQKAERLIAGVDGVAVQALFDPESWPKDRQLAALNTLLDQEFPN